MSEVLHALNRFCRRPIGAGTLVLTLGMGWLIPSEGFANEHHLHAAPVMANNPSSLQKETLRRPPDVRVVDQNGLELSFHRDLFKNRVIVVSFIYTTCTAICSPLTANLKRARDLLDPDLAEQAALYRSASIHKLTPRQCSRPSRIATGSPATGPSLPEKQHNYWKSRKPSQSR